MTPRTRRVLVRAVSLATMMTLALPAWSGAQQARGTLVLLGGEPGGDAINTRFVRLARAAGTGPIVVLPMASPNAAEVAASRERIFRALGAATVTLDITRENASSDSVARILGSASGIWFTGGSPTRLTAAILGTPALDSVRARFVGGAVVGGSSAGVMAMSDSIFTGMERSPGARWRTTDTSAAEPNSTIERDNVLVAPGFGLLRGAIIYPHFIRRQRYNRLISRVLEHPAQVGVGIDELAAVVVLPSGEWEIIGESQVLIFDARSAQAVGATFLGARGVQLHVLGPGDRWSPRESRNR